MSSGVAMTEQRTQVDFQRDKADAEGEWTAREECDTLTTRLGSVRREATGLCYIRVAVARYPR